MLPLATVREHMDTHVPTVQPDMPILDAGRYLLKHKVTGAPVVDGAGQLVGILTEFDCLKVLTTEGAAASRGKVAEYMTTNVVTIPPDMPISYAAGIFLRSHFRRLIVAEGGKVVGAITRYDILRFMAKSLE